MKRCVRVGESRAIQVSIFTRAGWQKGALCQERKSLHALSFSKPPFISLLPHFLDCAWCNPTRPGATLAHHSALSMSQWRNYENNNFVTWIEKGHVVWIDMQRRWKWCNFLNSVIMVMCNGNAFLLSKISLSAWIVQLCAVCSSSKNSA